MSEIDAARILTRSEIEVLAGECLSNANRDLYTRIRDMTNDKIAAYQSASGGAIEKDVADGIIGVLTTDVQICDALIATDFDDPKSVDKSIEVIKAIVKHSPRPSHQVEYIRGLTDNEASMEIFYGKVITELQDRIRG